MVKDKNNSRFSNTNQYKKNNALIIMRIDTPKFKTDKKAKVLGGKYGKMKDRSKSNAKNTLI
ncbi:hypothetical protein [Gaetbulibacter aestuarii]|uniref:Uncharacterized protein n=1 Tax=Gaetbulibacter aestuarii TaxID=1502358 RepID=A0ABW7MXM4_9FLAO